MYLKKFLFCSTLALFLSASSYAQEILQWRGADRSGAYKESNLLKSWPATGPALLWESDDIGNGYGSPIITKNNIFIEGEIDTVNYLFALDLKGKFLWKSRIGKEWILSYPGARTTPTFVDNLIYATAGWGAVACFDARTGKQVWAVDMVKDFNAKVPRFGFAESVLVEGNKVYISPGSADTNVVALDRFTGKTIWMSKGTGQITSYCSPLLIQLPTRNIMVTFSKNILFALDTKDGKVLWTCQQAGEDCQANTPLYEDGYIYYIAGDGNGAGKLRLSADGSSITEMWKNGNCDNLFSGFNKVNNNIYASGYGKRLYYALDATTGALTDSVKFDRGTMNCADGMLYLYNERGMMGLFKPNGPKLEQVSSFKVTKGTKAHYAHPVILNGILYVRHGKALLAYDIKMK